MVHRLKKLEIIKDLLDNNKITEAKEELNNLIIFLEKADQVEIILRNVKDEFGIEPNEFLEVYKSRMEKQLSIEKCLQIK